MSYLKECLNAVAAGARMSEDEAMAAFEAILAGEVNDIEMAAFLTALRIRGETIDELVGACRAVRSRMIPIGAPQGTIDVCGTGGDGRNTVNISTAVAFVVAACDVPVAKHGNRSVTSQSGASDVLTALGVPLDLSFEAAEEILHTEGLVFLNAPRYHPAMKHVAPVRQALGFRTIFNLIGPLCNPAEVERQLIGVATPQNLKIMSEALRRLGSECAWLVYGVDGLDEMSLSDLTQVVEIRENEMRRFNLAPEDVGFGRITADMILGGTAQENAAAMIAMLEGEKNAYRDCVLFNAAGALIAAGQVETLRKGVRMAQQAIDSGAARARLERMRGLKQAAA